MKYRYTFWAYNFDLRETKDHTRLTIEADTFEEAKKKFIEASPTRCLITCERVEEVK